MRIGSTLTGGIAAIALVSVSASPAAARGWDYGHYHHHDDGPSAGAVIGVIAGIGLLAAIAASASKNKQDAETRRYDTPPPRGYDDRRYDDRTDDRSYNGQRYDDGAGYDSRGSSQRYDEASGVTSSEDAAVDGCAVAARDQASRNGDYAEVQGITSVAPKGTGWDVTGTLDQRSGYRSKDGWSRSFRCTWDGGQVRGLSLN